MSDEQTSNKVLLYVYDLSHGLASVYSEAFIGIKLNAIYHTSIVVFEREYYFDQQVSSSRTPGATRFGTPIRVVDLGETFITEDVLDEYLNSLKTEGDFKIGDYHLFHNNCNHFSNEVAQFLNGSEVEDEILKLPEQVLNSPNGAAIQQMFSGVAP